MSATLSLQPAGGSLAGIALQIANWHAYSYDGESLSNIGDGGNDMYDNGNRVSWWNLTTYSWAPYIYYK